MRALGLALILGICTATPLLASQRSDDALQASRSVIGKQVPDFTFQNGDKKIRLSDFRGKPLLVNLIYTGCADVCPPVIESLANAREGAESALGPAKFNIITVGFDTRRDTPERMRSFAEAHAAGGEGWYFLASSPDTIEAFSAAVGFSYFASAGGFGHVSQVTILDGEGKVYDQVYGSTFDVPAIVEPLKWLIFGGERPVTSLTGLGDRVRLLCTVYDPRTGRYYFNYSIFVSILIGALCLLGVLWFMLRELRKTLRAPEPRQ